MKLLIASIFLLMLAPVVVSAQAAPTVETNYTNIASAGISYGSGVSGTALYARKLSELGTYSFTVLDAVPTSMKPLTVTTQVATGVAQRVATIGKVDIFIPAAAGVSWSGTNTGWAWTTGVLASVPVGKIKIMPSVRVVKSSVNNNSDYQVIGGVMLGIGWN